MLVLAVIFLYAALSETRVLGTDLGAGPASPALFWFCLLATALSVSGLVCYCRVTPLTVHLSKNQFLIAFLRPLGSSQKAFDGSQLIAVRELSVGSEWGYSPTMYRMVMYKRWLPILLDERADVLHLAPIQARSRDSAAELDR